MPFFYLLKISYFEKKIINLVNTALLMDICGMRILPLFCILFCSCHQISKEPVKVNTNTTNDSISTLYYGDTTLMDTSKTDDLELSYIVVADTSLDYYYLMNEAINYSKNTDEKLDSMGRYFDSKMQKIVLPMDSEDEIYRGEYYPRRYVEEYFSVEYMSTYYNQSNPKLMATVAGIYDSAKEAQNRLNKIKSQFPKAFYFKSLIYIGCMH